MVRGVNLGGWLVLEPWITPRFFEQVKYRTFLALLLSVSKRKTTFGQPELISKIFAIWPDVFFGIFFEQVRYRTSSGPPRFLFWSTRISTRLCNL